MSYHDNPSINGALLTIINDGDGSQCGLSYAERCALARHASANTARVAFILAARRVLGTLRHAREAGYFLYDYYCDRVREIDARGPGPVSRVLP